MTTRLGKLRFDDMKLAISALHNDQRGASLVTGLLVLAALTLGTVGAVKGLGGRFGGKVDCTGQAIVSLSDGAAPCQDGESGSGVAQLAEVSAQGSPQSGTLETAPVIEDGEGPALIQAGPLVALPFPGTASVSCTARPGQKDRCKDQPGVAVQATGELSIERSQTRLDANGCAKQDLSVSAKLQVELSGKAKGKEIGGTLAVFRGSASKFKATVSPEAADLIARRDLPPPNPVDPASIGVGDSVELSEEFFTGHKLQATYRQLQGELGFDAGRRLSSGVKRIDPTTARVLVGDADFVREALSLGVSLGDFGISVGGKAELSDGDLRAVDLDIGTAAGFEAYQRFLAEGKLPPIGAAGTKDPVKVETLDFSDATKLEAKLGRFKLGGILADSEGHLTETKHEGGILETAINARFNDVGLAIKEIVGPSGPPQKSFSLLIEGASRTSIENFEGTNGTSLAASPDGNVRLDFSEADLRKLQGQAFDQLVQRAKDKRIKISPDELRRRLRDDPRRLNQSGLNEGGTDFAFEIASAKTPEDVLRFLYLSGGAGDATRALDNLIGFATKTARARNGNRESPKDHPESQFPGTAVAPVCN